MTHTIYLFILLILCGSMLLLMVVFLFLLFGVRSSQKELLKLYKAANNPQSLSTGLSGKIERKSISQGTVAEAKKCGLMICRKCYAPIEESCRTCPACKTETDRR